jgi:hypothetical protein
MGKKRTNRDQITQNHIREEKHRKAQASTWCKISKKLNSPPIQKIDYSEFLSEYLMQQAIVQSAPNYSSARPVTSSSPSISRLLIIAALLYLQFSEVHAAPRSPSKKTSGQISVPKSLPLETTLSTGEKIYNELVPLLAAENDERMQQLKDFFKFNELLSDSDDSFSVALNGVIDMKNCKIVEVFLRYGADPAYTCEGFEEDAFQKASKKMTV